MSQYPPGVTGAEYEIAGPDWEREEIRECHRVSVEIAVKRRDNDQGQLIEVDECPFVGEVTVQGYRGESWWECPFCGSEHTEDDCD